MNTIKRGFKEFLKHSCFVVDCIKVASALKGLNVELWGIVVVQYTRLDNNEEAPKLQCTRPPFC